MEQKVLSQYTPHTNQYTVDRNEGKDDDTVSSSASEIEIEMKIPRTPQKQKKKTPQKQKKKTPQKQKKKKKTVKQRQVKQRSEKRPKKKITKKETEAVATTTIETTMTTMSIDDGGDGSVEVRAQPPKTPTLRVAGGVGEGGGTCRVDETDAVT